MTYNEMLAIIQAKIDDSTTDISSDIYNAVRFLNNFFALEQWNDTYDTTADQNYVALTDILGVDVCYIDGDQIEKLNDFDIDKIPKFEEEAVQRFYFLDDKLYFTVAPTESSLTVKILEKYRFSLPTGTDSFDVPTELLELVELGAISRYYTNLISITAQNRENLPDVSIDEIRRAKNYIDEAFDRLLTKLRFNSPYAL